jgi:tetratricopeptide (TPR) repeat protein
LASFQTEQGRQTQWERATAVLALARAAAQQQNWDEAVAYCAQQLDSLPHEPGWNSARKALCREMAAWDEVFNRLVKLRPDDIDLWVGRGRHFVILRDWKQALSQYEKVQSNLPPNSERLEYACLLLLSNDNARYEQYVNQIKSDDVAVRTMVTAIAPQAIVPAGQVIQWSKQDTRYAGQPRPPAAFIQALVYYRAGQFEDALKSAQALNNHNWPATSWSQNWLVQAMAAHRIGDTTEARRCMTEARKLLASAPPVEKYDPTTFPVGDMLGAEVLLREADALLKQPPVPAPATQRQSLDPQDR